MEPEIRVRELAARSAAFSLVARLIRDAGEAAGWDAARAASARALAAYRACPAAAPETADLLEQLAAAMDDDVEAAFRYTFGHVPAGAFSPYETSYGAPNAFNQAQILADLGGYYAAFGVEPSGAYRERPDHLGAELEFVALLLYKEAVATLDAQAEGVEVCAAARRRFLQEHVGRWGPVLLERLEREAPEELYRLCGRLGRRVLAAEAAALGAQCLPFELGPPPPEGIVEEFCPEMLACPGTAPSEPLEL